MFEVTKSRKLKMFLVKFKCFYCFCTLDLRGLNKISRGLIATKSYFGATREELRKSFLLPARYFEICEIPEIVSKCPFFMTFI